MEIDVGDYVRTRAGHFYKITKIDKNGLIYWNKIQCGWSMEQLKDIVAKHSKNIIDLIEVGDYVNGCYVEDIFEKGKKIFNTVPESDKGILKNRELCICKPHSYGGIDWIRKEEDIKTIVTKEQFASIEYKVEENK